MITDDLNTPIGGVRIVASEALERSKTLMLRGGHPVYIGMLSDVPDGLDYDTMYLNPGDMVAFRAVARKAGIDA